jgi:hypothetical protein
MKAAAPMMRDQWRARLMLIEERLAGGKAAGGGQYLLTMKPGLVDVHAYMNVWWMAKAVPDFMNACFETAPLTHDWYARLAAVEGQAPETITSQRALDIAKNCAPRLVAATTDYEPQQFASGEKVAVAPDDYGIDWVKGDLVHADAQRIILKHFTPEAETIHVHFPRAGYLVRRA